MKQETVSCGMRNFRNAKMCGMFRTACVDVPSGRKGQAVRAKLFSAQAVRAKSSVAAVRLTATVAAMSDADAPAHKKRKAGGRPINEKTWKHFKQITLPPDKECKAGM